MSDLPTFDTAPELYARDNLTDAQVEYVRAVEVLVAMLDAMPDYLLDMATEAEVKDNREARDLTITAANDFLTLRRELAERLIHPLLPLGYCPVCGGTAGVDHSVGASTGGRRAGVQLLPRTRKTLYCKEANSPHGRDCPVRYYTVEQLHDPDRGWLLEWTSNVMRGVFTLRSPRVRRALTEGGGS